MVRWRVCRRKSVLARHPANVQSVADWTYDQQRTYTGTDASGGDAYDACFENGKHRHDVGKGRDLFIASDEAEILQRAHMDRSRRENFPNQDTTVNLSPA